MNEPSISAGDLSRALRLSLSTVIRRIQDGKFRGFQDRNGRWKVPLSEFNRLVDEGDKPFEQRQAEGAPA